MIELFDYRLILLKDVFLKSTNPSLLRRGLKLAIEYYNNGFKFVALLSVYRRKLGFWAWLNLCNTKVKNLLSFT